MSALSVREPRFLTSLLLIGAGLFAVLRGLTLVGFGWGSLGAPDAARLQAYADAPGAGAFAREALIATAATPPEARAAAERAVIGRPMSGALWLALAQADLAAGAPLEKALSAAAMSLVTAPNEGGVVAARVAILLPLWPVLPADMRRGLIDDLVGSWILIDEQNRRAAVASVQTMPEIERLRLQQALQGAGSGAKQALHDLGLGS